MDSLRRLEELFTHFPGIGPRQAKRFVYYILSKSPSFARELTQLIEEVRKATNECARCHRFYLSKAASAGTACPTCSDASRDASLLMIVARDSDFESIEKSGAYRGFYFILGGTVPILEKEPERRIRIELMRERINFDPDLKEVIISMDTTSDGENTAQIVREAIQTLTTAEPFSESTPSHQITVTVLGRGLSTGAELEYVDSDTIRNALKNRH